MKQCVASDGGVVASSKQRRLSNVNIALLSIGTEILLGDTVISRLA